MAILRGPDRLGGVRPRGTAADEGGWGDLSDLLALPTPTRQPLLANTSLSPLALPLSS